MAYLRSSESMLTKSLHAVHAADHSGVSPLSPLGDMATKVDNGDAVYIMQTSNNERNHPISIDGVDNITARHRGDSLPIDIPGCSKVSHEVDTFEPISNLKLEDLPETSVDILGTAPKKEQKWSFSSVKSPIVASYQPVYQALDVQKNNFFTKRPKLEAEFHAEDGRLIFNQFPPLPNELFELSSDLRGAFFKANPHEPSLDGKAIVEEWLEKEKKLLKIEADADARHSEAIKVAEKFKFNKICYSGGVAGHDNKAQFIEDYAKGRVSYSKCSVCGDNHIPSGAPIDLPERDTCCSMLPEWWPRDMGFENKTLGSTQHTAQPWKAWNLVWKEYCFQDDFAKGYKDHIHGEPPLPRQWDKNWHEGKEWEIIGRKQGWWKCRTKENGGSFPEIGCRVCHVKSDEVIPEINGFKKGTKEYAALRRDEIAQWINDLVAEGGKEDRIWVLNNINNNRQIKAGMTGFDF